MSLEFVVGNPRVVVLACLVGADVVCWCSCCFDVVQDCVGVDF